MPIYAIAIFSLIKISENFSALNEIVLKIISAIIYNNFVTILFYNFTHLSITF